MFSLARNLGSNMEPNQKTTPLLSVENLCMHFPVMTGVIVKRQTGSIRAVDNVSLKLEAGETLGIVGESGCGKSTLGRAIMRLYEPTSGSVSFAGRDLSGLSRRELIDSRKDIQMVFQDPYASLDPRKTVSSIVAEPFVIHGTLSARQRRERVRELLVLVELNPDFEDRYPHEFSGGQRQRIGIARALALNPKVIICDEPISALDVSIQAQIINLFNRLQREFGISYIFISHDLNMVRQISHRVAVMYLGKIVELASREKIFSNPKHPYTQALLSAICEPDPSRNAGEFEVILEGDPPSPANPPSGCVFNTRCRFATDLCKDIAPQLGQSDPHQVACHYSEELGANRNAISSQGSVRRN